MVVEFYRQLYHDDEISKGLYPSQNAFPTINFCLFESIGCELSDLEVRSTLFEMARLKALGIDGMHAKFY